jgi:HAD superfamily hydrolase (TIGR01549 family)
MPRKIVPSLTGRTIRCILFDFGDTLWTRKDAATWQQAEQEGNKRVVALLHKLFPAETLPASDPIAFGEQFRKTVETQARQLMRPRYEPNFALATQQALQQIGLPTVESAVAAEIFEALRVRIPESRHLFDDILPTLAELQRRNFLLGVVTNRWHGGEPFLEDLQIMGLLDYFDADHMAISADLGIRKPNPAIFQYALDALHVPAEEAAMVGDSFGADVVGAKHLNIFAIWKTSPRLRAEVSKILPAGATLDDRHLVAYSYKRSAQKYGLSPEDSQTRPDLIIEHLQELLDVFLKAGPQ